MIFFILLLAAGSAHAQKFRDTIFYNANWEITEKPFAHYYRAARIEEGAKLYFSGPVRDHFMNGKLEMEGAYNAKGKREGRFRFFHPSGKLKCEGDFADGQPQGVWSFFYGDGLPKAEIVFKDNDFVFLEYADSARRPVLENGSGRFKWWVNNATFPYGLIKGKFKDGKKAGTWKYYTRESYTIDRSVWEEDYRNGQFKMGYLTVFKYNPQVGSSIFKTMFMVPEKFEKTDLFIPDFYIRNSGNASSMESFLIGRQELLFVNRYRTFDHAMEYIRNVLNACSGLFDHARKKYNGKLTFLIKEGRVSDLKIEGELDERDQWVLQLLMGKFRNLLAPVEVSAVDESYCTLYFYSYNLQALLKTKAPAITSGNLLFSENSFQDFINSFK